MNLFRTTKEKFSSLDKAFNGQGSLDGGRWNRRNQPVIYSASSFESSVSEAAWYAIVKPMLFEKPIWGTSEFEYRNFINQKRVVLEFQVKDGLDLAQLKTQGRLSYYCKKLKFKEASIHESVLCDYGRIRGRWTQNISYIIESDLSKEGLACLSARSNAGFSHPLYCSVVNGDQRIEILARKEILLSAVDRNEVKLSYGETPLTNKVLCEMPGEPSSLIEVLRYL